MRITPDARKIDYSEGSLVSDDAVEITDRCDDPSVGAAQGMLLQAVDAKDRSASLCYEVVELNDQSLTRMYLPRGNMLEFRKIGE